mgnify:CR=1 FL=1
MQSISVSSEKQQDNDRLIPAGEVIGIVKAVRNQYVPEVFPESSLLADYICGEIISGVKEAGKHPERTGEVPA